jgi:hypothetical protein
MWVEYKLLWCTIRSSKKIRLKDSKRQGEEETINNSECCSITIHDNLPAPAQVIVNKAIG